MVLEVSDAGRGILAADHARAMAPFTQLDPARGVGGRGGEVGGGGVPVMARWIAWGKVDSVNGLYG